MSFVIPEYSLPFPRSKESLSSVQENLLDAAMGEINADVHETASPERIGKYWSSLGMAFDGSDRNMPWNAAFLSWVIAQSGNPNKLKLAPNVSRIWTDAVGKDLSFFPDEKKPMPGDLVFFLAGRSVSNENIKKARSGKLTRFNGHCGLVYEAFDDNFSSIEGNVRNGLHLVERTYDNSKATVCAPWSTKYRML